MRNKDPLVQLVRDFNAPEDARPLDFVEQWSREGAFQAAWDESCDVEAMCILLVESRGGWDKTSELRSICELVHRALVRLCDEFDERFDSMLDRVDRTDNPDLEFVGREIRRAKEQIEEHRDAAATGEYRPAFETWFRWVSSYAKHPVQGELAVLFRELVPHPPSFDELLRFDREQREMRIREEALRPKRPPKPTVPRRVPFAEVFERRMKLPLPFSLRPGCVPISEYKHGAETWELLVGTPPACEKQLLIVEDLGLLESLPPDYFFTGFWGHGINSHAFYLCDVDVSRRAYFRIPYGNAYGDINQERANVVACLERYLAFINQARFHRLMLFDAIGSAGYELELVDGRKFEQSDSSLNWSELEQHAGLPSRE